MKICNKDVIYEYLKKTGEGAYSSVFKVKRHSDG